MASRITPETEYRDDNHPDGWGKIVNWNPWDETGREQSPRIARYFVGTDRIEPIIAKGNVFENIEAKE